MVLQTHTQKKIILKFVKKKKIANVLNNMKGKLHDFFVISKCLSYKIKSLEGRYNEFFW